MRVQKFILYMRHLQLLRISFQFKKSKAVADYWEFVRNMTQLPDTT